LKHIDISEICLGLILANRISPDHVNAEAFAYPYDEAVKLIKGGSDISILYDKIGLAPIKAAVEASKVVDEKLPGDWIKLLDMAYSREEMAKMLEKQVVKIKRGEEPEVLKITGAIEKFRDMQHRYITMDLIDPEDAIWVKTGYRPIDEMLGGIPDSCLTIIAARPGVGKTSLMLKLAESFAGQGKAVLLFTFEMTNGQLVSRLLNISPDISMEIRKSIMVCDDIMGVDEVVAEASRLAAMNKLGFIGIDFADLMMTGEEDEPKMGMLYRQMARMAKEAKTPVILLSQLNRLAAGKEPTIHDIRWSGLAEAMAALIFLIYNPNQTASGPPDPKSQLDIIPGFGWLIVGKSRFGFGPQLGYGAIKVKWDGQAAWLNDEYSWKGMQSV